MDVVHVAVVKHSGCRLRQINGFYDLSRTVDDAIRTTISFQQVAVAFQEHQVNIMLSATDDHPILAH